MGVFDAVASAGAGAASGSAAGPWGALIGAGIGLFGNLFGAHMQAETANNAAEIQAAALKYSADQQRAAQADALRYQEGQSGLDRATAETNRAANYGQWAARESRIGSLGQLAGLPQRQIPDYVPLNGAAAGSGAPTADVNDAAAKFFDAVQSAGLDPVAVQGHGKVIADAVNAKYPGIGVTVDPKTDAIVWPGIGPLDVTIDSGKGGWSFRPSGSGASAPMTTGNAALPRSLPPDSLAALAMQQQNLPPALTGKIFLPGSLRQMAA